MKNHTLGRMVEIGTPVRNGLSHRAWVGPVSDEWTGVEGVVGVYDGLDALVLTKTSEVWINASRLEVI